MVSGTLGRADTAYISGSLSTDMPDADATLGRDPTAHTTAELAAHAPGP